MEKKKSLKFNAVLNVIKELMTIIFPMITFPYATRVLGLDNYGKYTFISRILLPQVFCDMRFENAQK